MYALVNPASNHGIQKYVREITDTGCHTGNRACDRTINLRLVNDCKVYASHRVHGYI